MSASDPKPQPRPQALRVALVGFSEFERTTLSTCFRLAAEPEQRYELVNDVSSANLLVADADNSPSVQLVVVTERLAETVFIGSHPPPGATGSMRRPIDTLHVMRALDALANRDSPVAPQAPATLAEAAVESAPADVILESMLRMPLAKPEPGAPPADAPAARQMPKSAGLESAPAAPPASSPFSRTRTPTARRPTAHSALTAPRRAPARPPFQATPAEPFFGPPLPPSALLVDDSKIALRFLAAKLEPWCMRCDTAATSHEALDKLDQRAYDFIFLDLELGPDSELDGLALCRQIKRSELAMNATVVIVSAHHSEIDRARGSLAGCDGYLSKPLADAELASLLRRQGLVPPTGEPIREASRAGAWPA